MSLSFAYQLGRHMINGLPLSYLNIGKEPFIMDIGGTKFWDEPGDNDVDYPSWQYPANTYHYYRWVDRHVEKVNWLKLKTLTIGYTLPQKWMKKVGLKANSCGGISAPIAAASMMPADSLERPSFNAVQMP